MTGTNGNGTGSARVGTSTVKQGLAQMLKGGVIVSGKAVSRFFIEMKLEKGKYSFRTFTIRPRADW